MGLFVRRDLDTRTHIQPWGAGRQKRERRERKLRRMRANMQRFTIDYTRPVEYNLHFDPAAFEQFMKEKIKVDGKLNNLKGKVMLEPEPRKLNVYAKAPFSKRYLKYLTKKFLKKKDLRDWLRIIAAGKEGYELVFFDIHAGDDESDSDDE